MCSGLAAGVALDRTHLKLQHIHSRDHAVLRNHRAHDHHENQQSGGMRKRSDGSFVRGGRKQIDDSGHDSDHMQLRQGVANKGSGQVTIGQNRKSSLGERRN